MHKRGRLKYHKQVKSPHVQRIVACLNHVNIESTNASPFYIDQQAYCGQTVAKLQCIALPVCIERTQCLQQRIDQVRCSRRYR